MKLVSHHPSQVIEEKIRLFDSLKGKAGEGAIRNRAGWLYSAIVHDYTVAEPAPARPVCGTSARELKTVVEPAPSEPNGVDAAFDVYWASLSVAEHEVFEAAAVNAASPFLQKQYREGRAGQGSLWRATRQRILTGHHRRLTATDSGVRG